MESHSVRPRYQRSRRSRRDQDGSYARASPAHPDAADTLYRTLRSATARLEALRACSTPLAVYIPLIPVTCPYTRTRPARMHTTSL